MDYPIDAIPLDDLPLRFREIPQPPEKIWIRGKLPDLERPTLTVVGARKHSEYGRAACEHLLRGLAGTDIIIVSGLAIGIDSIAHDCALRAGLTTIAVPGSGLDDRVLYPRQNVALAKRILVSGGSLISEFPPEFRATNWSFPQRNRIMAGLSHAVLIVEAAPRSGTLITARLATDYNRDVLAVPGDIFSELSRGPNTLIEQGATPISSSEDILRTFGIETAEHSTPTIADDTLPKEERDILSLLATPKEKEVLVNEIGLPASAVHVLLMRLEIAGYIIDESNIIRRIL